MTSPRLGQLKKTGTDVPPPHEQYIRLTTTYLLSDVDISADFLLSSSDSFKFHYFAARQYD